MKNKKEIAFEIIAIILIILFAVSISPKTLQNDTFYTVSIGELILNNGIDMQDHFSWHENLEYTYPHWLYDVMMYLIYSIDGFTAIYISTCVFAAILGIAIYKVNSKLTKNKILSFIVTIGVLYLLKGYIAARAQLVTFILFILLLYNIERFLQNKKFKNVIAILLIHTLIANLHVAVWPFTFVLYLPYIVEYLLCEVIELVLYKKIQIKQEESKIKAFEKYIENFDKNKNKEKVLIKKKEKLKASYEKLENLKIKANKIKEKREENLENSYKIVMKKNTNVRWLLFVFGIAIFTGLLTPLGTTPYTYTYYTLEGNTMQNINEHLPLTLINNTPILCTIVIFLMVMTFTKAKIKLHDLFIISGLTLLMFSSRRQASMFALIGSVAFTRMTTSLISEYIDCNVKDLVKKWFNKFTGFVMIAVMLILCVHFYKDIKDDEYISESSYPVDASTWILNNLDVENIRLFNEYNYGSYLLYRGIPVFIDSRADLYTQEFNRKTMIINDVFTDFINASNIGVYYEDIFEKYDITHIILYKNSKINMLIEETDSEKYNLLYSDDHFVIYER